MIITLLCAGLILLCGIFILMGKGDWMIAGYNTAKKEEKEKINIKRLRLITAIVCFLATVLCAAMPFMASATDIAFITMAFVAITIVLLIVANTWCKKK